MAKAGTVAGDIEVAQALAKDLPPPPHVKLRPQDVGFYRAIIDARARNTWNQIDLAHAVNLARTQADIESVQRDLDAEGFTLVNERGTTVQNPKFSILETLSRRAVLLSKTLQVHAHATVGESREQVARNKRQAKVQSAQEEADDLIARPMH